MKRLTGERDLEGRCSPVLPNIDCSGLSAGKLATECAGRADETGAEEDEGAWLGGRGGGDIGEDEVVVVVEVGPRERFEAGDPKIFHSHVGACGDSADATGVRRGIGVVVAVVVVVGR